MAKAVLKDAVLFVNGTDLSDHVQSLDVDVSREEVDVTAMGADYKETIFGIPDATVTVTFFNDTATGKVFDVIKAVALTDTPFPIRVRTTSGAIAATNQEIQMNVLCPGWHPIAGDVSSANMTEVVFRNADQTGVVYDSTP